MKLRIAARPVNCVARQRSGFGDQGSAQRRSEGAARYSKVENVKAKMLAPIHPGEILREDVLKPLNMSVSQLTKSLAVDVARLNEFVRGRRGITADTALRLARYLGTTPEFYELRVARQAAIRSRVGGRTAMALRRPPSNYLDAEAAQEE